MACVFVPIISDDRREPDELFLASLIEDPLFNLSPTNSQTTITILNDDCETLPNPFNGQVTLSGTAAGSVAMYTCEFSLELVGNATRECQIDGTWSGEEPICQRMLA